MSSPRYIREPTHADACGDSWASRNRLRSAGCASNSPVSWNSVPSNASVITGRSK
jgi:hypothetical protein